LLDGKNNLYKKSKVKKSITQFNLFKNNALNKALDRYPRLFTHLLTVMYEISYKEGGQ